MLVEQELIERARSGELSAFNEVVLAYRKRILGMISRLIGRPEDVEDVAQEVFVRLYYSFNQLRSAEVFEPWLHRLTVNASYDYLRRVKRRKESRMADLREEQVVMADASAGVSRDGQERQKTQARDFMNSLFRHVSDDDRLLLTLKEVEGLSLKDLEKIYGANENALKVRLFRARQRVLKAYKAAEADGKLDGG
ncbi:MAG: sigma-70 family RNA polymerase sigma factor [Bryobacteraceae bacterium]